MITDLLEAADLACRCYWEGQDRTKLVLQECMRELRACVNEEKRKRAKDETQKLTMPITIVPTIVAFQNSTISPPPTVSRPPPFDPGDRPHA